MNIVFFGTPTFAANVLDYLLKQGVNVLAVVTKPDKPQGRSLKTIPSAVKDLLKNKYPHIPILEPVKVSTEEYQKKLEAFHPDLFVVVAYGEIIKQNILDIPKYGSINVHASLLPKYRGAAPIHRAIIEGEVETGVSIMEVVLALDAGAVLHVKKIPIDLDMNVGELEKALEAIGAQALKETLDDYKNKYQSRQEQNHELASYASKILTEDCRVQWLNDSLDIHNLIRGVTPYPGAWCIVKIPGDVNPKRLKIKKTRSLPQLHNKKPGEIISFGKDGWVVAAGKGAVELLEVQLEGKKACTGIEFSRGYPAPEML
jgi:methionyl-tRNA formyltransferase